MERQWNTFERVENYNDIIFQRIQNGFRDELFYQFVDQGELLDYNNGQQLHNLTYPQLSGCGTFSSISLQTITQYPTYVPAPEIIMTTTLRAGPKPLLESEKAAQEADMATYIHVSTYNGVHTFQYNFTSDQERLSYYRAERIARMTALGLL